MKKFVSVIVITAALIVLPNFALADSHPTAPPADNHPTVVVPPVDNHPTVTTTCPVPASTEVYQHAISVLQSELDEQGALITQQQNKIDRQNKRIYLLKVKIYILRHKIHY